MCEMPQWHGSMLKRKPTGGKKRMWRGKRAFEMGGLPTETLAGPTKQRFRRGFGGSGKVQLAKADWAVVPYKAIRKASNTKLERLHRKPANVDYQSRRVRTKGAIIDT